MKRFISVFEIAGGALVTLIVIVIACVFVKNWKDFLSDE